MIASMGFLTLIGVTFLLGTTFENLNRHY
jgi:hypothetical protein